MSAHDELTAAWSEWQTASLYRKWRKANPGEAAKLDAYRAGGPRPTLATATGRALVDETAAWFATAPEPPPPPPPPTGFLRGHSSHGKSSQDLTHLRMAAKLDCYRDDALFESIFAGATPNWSYLDGRMANCQSAGIGTFLVIGCYGSTDPATYAAHCKAVVDRYRGNGVRLMIEVWNEPYMPSTYVDPATLAQMCAAAVEAINGEIPVGPNLDYIDYKTGQDGYAAAFVTAYPSGARRPAFVASHPYTDPPSLGVNTTTGNQKYRFDRILLLKNIVESHGWTGMPILASEWGWSSTDVGEQKQAEFAKQGFDLLEQWGVIGGFYYTGDRANTNAADRYSQYGIMRADGTDKPAVAAIGQSA